MTRHWQRVLFFIPAFLLVPAALAYVLSGGRWLNGTMTIHNGIPGTALSGASYATAFTEAAAQWNQTAFEFQLEESYVNPCQGYMRSASGTGFPGGTGNSINSIDFRDDVCGNDFGSGVLAITLSFTVNNHLGFEDFNEADIIFNNDYDWDVYHGPRRSQVDFRRVALHELGHALGLDHELTVQAIMSPQISNRSNLAEDDISGANSLYGEPTTCPITQLGLNSQVRDSLATGDCRIQQLYNNGNDTSFVDVFRLSLTEEKQVRLRMSSSELDSVLLITSLQLNALAVFDDSDGCDVDELVTLPIGEYLLLANTYVNPEKCAGNTGSYALSISDGPYPFLGNSSNTAKTGEPSLALFTGQSRLSAEMEITSAFTATDLITVEGRIDIDPAHVGQAGSLYILAVLSDGRRYMKTPDGFKRYMGNLSTLVALRSGVLAEVENLTVVRDLQGQESDLTDLDFSVYLGYALDSVPGEIHYGSKPIRFGIGP